LDNEVIPVKTGLNLRFAKKECLRVKIFLRHRSDIPRPAGSERALHRAVLTVGALVIAVCCVFAGAGRQTPALAAPLALSGPQKTGVFARAPEGVMMRAPLPSEDVPSSQDKK
jgi:hypothetical protein